MTTEEGKIHIEIFLPVMKELEAMGYNPVEVMFGDGSLPMNTIEACYVALNRAKARYPKWHKEVSKWINGIMIKLQKKGKK